MHSVVTGRHVFCAERTLLGALGEFCRCREEDVAGAVQRGFAGIFDDADDEAYADDLHGDIIIDAEGSTCYRNQQEGTAGYAGSTAGAYGGDDAQEKRCGEIHIDAEGIRRGQSENGNGNGRAGHIDGRAERDGNGVRIRIQAETFAQGQIDRNVGGRASGEESVHTGFTDGRPYERVRILPYIEEYDKRIHNESHEEVGGYENRKKLYVAEKGREAAGADRLGDQAHNAERREMNDPGDHLGDGFSDITEDGLGSVAAGCAESNAQDESPCEDADVIRVQQGIDRVIHNGKNQIVQDFHNAAGRIELRPGSDLQMKHGREEEGKHHAYDGSAEGTNYIENDNRLHIGFGIFFFLRHGIHDEEEYENRSDAFQRPYEEITENGNHRNDRRREYGDQYADDKTHCDLLNQGDLAKRFLNHLKQPKNPLLLYTLSMAVVMNVVYTTERLYSSKDLKESILSMKVSALWRTFRL